MIRIISGIKVLLKMQNYFHQACRTAWTRCS